MQQSNLMKSYFTRRRWLSAVLFFYFVGGLLTLLTPKMEVYPVFHWFLFALTPNPTTDYQIRIYNYGGREISPPRLYNKAGDLVRSPNSIRVHVMAESMGKAIEKGDEEALATTKALFQQTFLPHPSRYELVKISYDPMERWYHGKVKIEGVKFFETER